MKNYLVFIFSLIIFNSVTVQADSRIEYAGGLGLCANDQENLKNWYEKFGFSFFKYGIAYKTVLGKSSSLFHFGIYPTGKTGEFCKDASNAGFGIFYRVNNFKKYLLDLKKNGIKPIKVINGPEGKIAFFTDTEGNHVNLWEVSFDTKPVER